MTVIITLTVAGSDTGPFNLYSNLDGFVNPFESNVSRVDLLAGYTSILVPDGTTIIRVQSMNICKNYIDLYTSTTTTTSTTSSTTSTTTSSTTTTIPIYAYTGSGRSNTNEGDACADAIINNRTFFSYCDLVSFGPGCVLYTNVAMTNILLGYSFVYTNGANYDVNPATGAIIGLSAVQC
jgi:hypothetical protein